MLQGLFGNASEVDAKEIQRDLDTLLVEGEQIVKAFRVIRDLFVFTDKRLILIDRLKPAASHAVLNGCG